MRSVSSNPMINENVTYFIVDYKLLANLVIIVFLF